MKVLMIQRARQFSPNSVEKDRAILETVAERLRCKGHQVEIVSEEDTRALGSAACCRRDARTSPLCEVHEAKGGCPLCVLSMGRMPEILQWLKTLHGVTIINSPEGVENCTRCRLQTIMERIGTPIPPQEGSDGYWLKRGDAAAQSERDVVFVQDREALRQAKADMEQRGIRKYTVSAHVKGDLVKFYGVCGTGFFRYYYPTDDGQTKFDDEQRNGPAHHYSFDACALQGEAERLAEAVGVEVYGGDAIVRADGSFCFIDFNDWPSFSRCREEAAEAISQLI